MKKNLCHGNIQDMKTLRLLNGQWQGASIAHWLPSFPAATSSRGYALGYSILDLIVPSEGQVRVQVPIDMEWRQRVATDGILDKDLIMKQLEATFAILDGEAPDRGCWCLVVSALSQSHPSPGWRGATRGMWP